MANLLYRNKGDGTFEDVTSEGRSRQARPRLRDAVVRGGGVLRLRPGRRPRPVRLQLRDLGPEDGAALRAARDPRLLPPEQLQGAAQLALPQRGQRHLHGRLEGLGDPRADRQGHGAGGRATSTRTATPTCSWRTTREPNYLFRNRGNGSFEEMGFAAGVAYPESGRPLRGWAPTRATSTTTASPTLFHTALFERDHAGVPEPGQDQLHRADGPLGRLGAHALARRLGQRDRATSTTTGARTCSWPAAT